MDNYLLVYLWTKLSIIPAIFFFFLFILVCIFSTYIYLLKDEDWFYYKTSLNLSEARKEASRFKKELNEKFKSSKIVKLSIILFVIFSVLILVVPSKKDALLIYLTPKVYNSKSMQDSIDILNNLPSEIKEYIKEYIGITKKE